MTNKYDLKKYSKNNGEIDLINIFRILWSGKWIIIISVIFTSLITNFFVSKHEINYKVSTIIGPADRFIFIKYTQLNNFLNNKFYAGKSSNTAFSLDEKRVLKLIVDEFSDYEELLTVLQKKPYIAESIKNFSPIEKKRNLIKLAINFYISAPQKKREKDFIINFTWSNIEEGEQIFNEAIFLAAKNVQKKIVDELTTFSKLLEKNNLEKLHQLNYKLELITTSQEQINNARIEFLKDQALIAKKLDIEDNTLNLDMFFKNYYISDFNQQDTQYYLRGYKAINAEIVSIQNRTPQQTIFLTNDYFLISRKLVEIKSDLSDKILPEYINVIENENVKNWVDFDFLISSSNQLFNPFLYRMMGITFGLILGMFLLFILNMSKNFLLIQKKR